jgi:prophage antirepressor-like protein
LQLACEQGRAVVLVSHHDHYRSLNRSKKKNSKQIQNWIYCHCRCSMGRRFLA